MNEGGGGPNWVTVTLPPRSPGMNVATHVVPARGSPSVNVLLSAHAVTGQPSRRLRTRSLRGWSLFKRVTSNPLTSETNVPSSRWSAGGAKVGDQSFKV